MLIKQLLWRNWAQYSPPESPPLAHQDPAALLLPLVIHPSFSLLSLHPALLFIPSVLHVVLFQSLSISSLGAPALLCPLLVFSLGLSQAATAVIFLPLRTFSCLNPNILFIYVHGMLLSTSPPLSGLSLPERLTIPSASLLIYHPNGGYKKEKTTICRGRNSHRRAWKVFGLQLLIEFQS